MTIGAVTVHPSWEERTLAHDVAVLTLVADAPGFYAPRQADDDGGGRDGADVTPPVVVNHDPSLPITGSGVRVAGYGLISHMWTTTDTEERSVDVRVVAAAPCVASFERAEESTEPEPLSSLLHATMHVCAGVAAGGCDACHGDSGGPLYQSMRMPRLRAGGTGGRPSPPPNATAEEAAAGDDDDDNDDGDGDTNDDDDDTVMVYLLVGLTSFSPGCADTDTPTAYTRLSAYAGWINAVVGAGTGPVRRDGTRVGGPEDGATYSFAPSLVGDGGGGGRPPGGGGGGGGEGARDGEGRDPRREGGGGDDASAGGRRRLSAGAAVGIGVGVTAGVVLVAAAVLGGLRMSGTWRARQAGGGGGGVEAGGG